MITTIAASLSIVFLLGAYLVATGVRGARINDHHLCRRCRFDVEPIVASGASDPRCPECGADLSPADALRVGEHRRRPWRIALGVFFLIASLGAGSALVAGAASGFNLNTLKPVWMLQMESRSLTPATADAAVSELARRAAGGDLSARGLTRLAERALDVQADADARWRTGWGDIIEAAARGGLLTDEQIVKYAERTVNIVLGTSATIRHGDALPVSLRLGADRAAGSLGGAAAIFIELAEMRVEGAPTKTGAELTSALATGRINGGSVSALAPIDLSPGAHALEVDFRVRVHPRDDRLRPMVIYGGVAPPEDAEALSEWLVTRSATVEILPPGQDTITLVRDDSLRGAFRQTINARGSVVQVRDGVPHLMLTLTYGETPMQNVFRVYWKSPEGEKRFASTWQQVGSNQQSRLMGDIPGFTGDSIDIVFRTDPDRARRLGITEPIWDGVIELERVPVAWHVGKE